MGKSVQEVIAQLEEAIPQTEGAVRKEFERLLAVLRGEEEDRFAARFGSPARAYGLERKRHDVVYDSRVRNLFSRWLSSVFTIPHFHAQGVGPQLSPESWRKFAGDSLLKFARDAVGEAIELGELESFRRTTEIDRLLRIGQSFADDPIDIVREMIAAEVRQLSATMQKAEADSKALGIELRKGGFDQAIAEAWSRVVALAESRSVDVNEARRLFEAAVAQAANAAKEVEPTSHSSIARSMVLDWMGITGRPSELVQKFVARVIERVPNPVDLSDSRSVWKAFSTTRDLNRELFAQLASPEVVEEFKQSQELAAKYSTDGRRNA